MTLTFDETLDGNSVPAASAFTVRVNGSVVSLASVEPVAVSGDTVTLVLASALSSTDAVTVSYSKPSGSPLRGPDGEAPSFSGRSVTNLVGVVPSVSQVAISSTPADGEAYAPGEKVQVSLTFTEAVSRDRRAAAEDQAGAGLWGERWADYAGGSGTTTLAFDYTVAEPDRSTRGVAVLHGIRWTSTAARSGRWPRRRRTRTGGTRGWTTTRSTWWTGTGRRPGSPG